MIPAFRLPGGRAHGRHSAEIQPAGVIVRGFPMRHWSCVKILLIEDDAKIGKALIRGLDAEGFTVDWAADGEDGLWRAREGSHEVILLDILLPKLNGYRVCAELRSDGIWTPILMLTAKDGDLDEAEGLDTGADDYLTKPFSFPVLVSRIRALARRATERKPVPVDVLGLRLDPATRRVFHREVEVPLTSREFAVLEFLMRRAGTVISKSEILAGVWDFEFDGDPNIVEVYIKRLRTKLEEPGVIETVRGAGYRLRSGD